MKLRFTAILMAVVLTAAAFAGCGSSDKPAEGTAPSTSAATADSPAVDQEDAAYRRNNNAVAFLHMNKIGGAMLLSFSDKSDTVKLLKIENETQTELKSVSYYEHEYLYPLENVLGGKLLIDATHDDYIDLSTGKDIESGKAYSPDGSACEGFIDGGIRYVDNGQSLYRCDGGDQYTLIVTAEELGLDSIPPMNGFSYFTPQSICYQRCENGKTILCCYDLQSRSVTDELTVLRDEGGIDNLIVDGDRAYFSCDNAGRICMADFSSKKVTTLYEESAIITFNYLSGKIYAGTSCSENGKNGIDVIDPVTGSAERIIGDLSPDGLYFFDDQTLYVYGYKGETPMFIKIDPAQKTSETIYAVE